MKKHTVHRLVVKNGPKLEDRELRYSELLKILAYYEIAEERNRRGLRRLVRDVGGTRTVYSVRVSKPEEKLNRKLVSAIRRRFSLTPDHGVQNSDFYGKL